MIPPCSCSTPGRNPGTSTSVRRGILKASQKRTKRAAFSDALISNTPATSNGWLPIIPIVFPLILANVVIIFNA